MASRGLNSIEKSSGSPTVPLRESPKAEVGQALCAVMAGIHGRGWCDGTGGNFSCVLQQDPLELLMAPSGVDKGLVAPEALITVDAEGQLLHGSGKPSAETLLHLAIVKSRRAGAVLHTHSQAATLLSKMACPVGESEGAIKVTGLEMLKGLEGIKSHSEEVEIPVLANDQDLKRLSAAALPLLKEAPHGLLIAGHGLYAWGANLDVAKRHLEILEFLLEHQWREQVLMARCKP